MYKNANRAAWAEINVTNLDFNIRQIQQKVGPHRKVTGIIKADGYGHGAIKVADVLRANGIDSFGVATLSEAVRLRQAGFITEEIMVIGLTPDPYVDTIIEYNLTPVTDSLKNAEKFDIGLLFPDDRTASPAAKIFCRFVMEHIQTLSPFS